MKNFTQKLPILLFLIISLSLQELDIYSNSQVLYIKSSMDLVKSIEVYDIVGKRIFYTQGINNKEYLPNMKSMSRGTYITKVQLEDGGSLTKKFIN